MKYFVDQSGLIAWVDDNGKSNHPAITMHNQNFLLTSQYITFLSSDKAVDEEFKLWDSLTALAMAIEAPANHSAN